MIQIVLCLEIVAFTALVMSAIFLAVAYIPHERKVLNVKRSKNLVQLASVLLGSSGIVLVAQNYQLRDITFYVQVMAHIESAILILAMILLLTKNFNTQKFVFTQSIWIAACILILYGYYYVYKGSIQNGWYYLLNCIYIIQFFFYFFTYKHLFETWRNKKYQYGKYGSTIKFLWLLLNLMATFVMSMLFFPSRTLFSVLIVFYIITFITFTILFYRLLIILNIADFEREYQYNMKGRDGTRPVRKRIWKAHCKDGSKTRALLKETSPSPLSPSSWAPTAPTCRIILMRTSGRILIPGSISCE